MIVAKKFYVVWKGRTPGIFTTWNECKAQVDGFAGAKYKSFPTQAEAEAAYSGKPSAVPVKPKGATKQAKPNALTQAQIDDMPYQVKIFTDGASEPNPGESGTGIAVYRDNKIDTLWYGLYQAMGTNNTAELKGLHHALIMAKEVLAQGNTVAIYCDSKYSIDCITKWAKGWQKKGWTKSGGEIKNLDIIQPAFELYQQIEADIKIHHVNGHVGIEGNELADRMSIVAIDTKEPALQHYQDTDDISEILALRTG